MLIWQLFTLRIRNFSQSKAPNKMSSIFSGTQDKCAACQKTVYPLEKVEKCCNVNIDKVDHNNIAKRDVFCSAIFGGRVLP
jgi:hypothetical protein